MESELKRILFAIECPCYLNEISLFLCVCESLYTKTMALHWWPNGLHFALNATNLIQSLLDWWHRCGLRVISSEPAITHKHLNCVHPCKWYFDVDSQSTIFVNIFFLGHIFWATFFPFGFIDINWIIWRWIIIKSVPLLHPIKLFFRSISSATIMEIRMVINLFFAC